MKMFVWVNPYLISYGGSSVVAVANTVDEAKAIAMSSAAKSFSFGEYKQDNPMVALKDPTHVFDVPCAMWDRWKE